VLLIQSWNACFLYKCVIMLSLIAQTISNTFSSRRPVGQLTCHMCINVDISAACYVVLLLSSWNIKIITLSMFSNEYLSVLMTWSRRQMATTVSVLKNFRMYIHVLPVGSPSQTTVNHSSKTRLHCLATRIDTSCVTIRPIDISDDDDS